MIINSDSFIAGHQDGATTLGVSPLRWPRSAPKNNKWRLKEAPRKSTSSLDLRQFRIFTKVSCRQVRNFRTVMRISVIHYGANPHLKKILHRRCDRDPRPPFPMAYCGTPSAMAAEQEDVNVCVIVEEAMGNHIVNFQE
ncbi:hypothetical protein [Streptomyces sp. enrichment culture]|uniref:hypothetical protein n=1 Tax=Streptomyces sp. enrichment culture TaxID=1795815 RepID=UPI003F554864